MFDEWSLVSEWNGPLEVLGWLRLDLGAKSIVKAAQTKRSHGDGGIDARGQNLAPSLPHQGQPLHGDVPRLTNQMLERKCAD